MATMAGRPRDQPYFVARGVGTGRKRKTKPPRRSGPLGCLEAGNHSSSKGNGGDTLENGTLGQGESILPPLLPDPPPCPALALSVSSEKILGPEHK